MKKTVNRRELRDTLDELIARFGWKIVREALIDAARSTRGLPANAVPLDVWRKLMRS